jgi:hypothetical protein
MKAMVEVILDEIKTLRSRINPPGLLSASTP